jgi:hypothetical protein
MVWTFRVAGGTTPSGGSMPNISKA